MPILLSAEQILAADDLKPEFVPTPEWHADPEAGVLVRGLTGEERDGWEKENFNFANSGKTEFTGKNMRARLCARCICDEKGKALFSSGQITALGRKSAAPLDRIYDKAVELSGIRAQDQEEAEKNSVPIQNGDSGSS